MKNSKIYNKWTEFITLEKYKKYFISNEEGWMINFNNVKKYIDENNKRPLAVSKEKDIKILGSWLLNQQNSYKSKEHIMKNSDIYSKWTEFITSEKYKKYFMSNEDEWKSNLNLVKKYIDENDKRPSFKNDKILQSWISTQLKNYKSKLQIINTSCLFLDFSLFLFIFVVSYCLL